MTRFASLFVALMLAVPVLAIAQAAGAQTAGAQDVAANSGPMIYGKDHPELIPDVSAYRLVFSALAVPVDATDNDRETQKAKLQPLQLSDSDQKEFVLALANFQTGFSALIEAHNREVALAAAQLQVLDDSDFLSKRDALVENIRGVLKKQMSHAGFKRLDDWIQGEKKNIKLSVVSR